MSAMHSFYLPDSAKNALLLPVFWLGLALAQPPLSKPPQVACGQDVVTVGDAWTKIQFECQAMEKMTPAGRQKRLPDSLALVIAHLRFMEANGIMLTERPLREVKRCLKGAEVLQRENWQSLEAIEETLADDKEPATWEELKSLVDQVGHQFPEEALLSTETFAHLSPPQEPLLHLQMEPRPLPPPGESMKVRFQLVQVKDLTPVSKEQLQESHGARMHALLCEPGLEDFHHVHPAPAEGPGNWEFTFTPRCAGPYTLWLNVVPLATGREESPFNIVTQPPEAPPAAPTFSPAHTATSSGVKADLTWDAPAQAHTASQGRIRLTTDKGQPLTGLEPYMGAAAHLVAIHSDVRTLSHMHPVLSLESGAPTLEFRLTPTLPGLHRLFLQIQVSDSVILLPLTVHIR